MRRADLPPPLAQLADEQAGVLSLGACLDAGLTSRQIHRAVSAGRWQRPFPRALVVFSGPLPALTLVHAALAYAGEGAVASHATAGWLWGLGPLPTRVTVSVPYPREPTVQPGLIVVRSRTLRPEHVHPARRPARTRVERTVVDLLPRCRNAREALALAAEAIRSRRTTAERLRAQIEALPCLRWRREVLAALPDVAAGAHSVLEIADAKLRRRHGLPPGRRQVRIDADGVIYVDIELGEYRLRIEYDGRLGHDRILEIWRDMARDNAAALQGYLTLRYGAADVLLEGCRTMYQQAQVLAQRGWTGEFRRCPRCPAELTSPLRPTS